MMTRRKNKTTKHTNIVNVNDVNGVVDEVVDDVVVKDDVNAKPRSIFEEVWLSVLTPGLPSARVVALFSGVFYALFATLVGLALLTRGNPHVLILLVLAIGLFLSVSWFIAEARLIQHQDNNSDSPKTS